MAKATIFYGSAIGHKTMEFETPQIGLDWFNENSIKLQDIEHNQDGSISFMWFKEKLSEFVPVNIEK